MRLGFAVKVLGQPDLKSHDTRRWQNEPHLSVSLAYVRDILGYLGRAGIRMYRLSSDLAPYLTHPGLPQFHHQIDECAAELALVGQMAREVGLRLSFHPSQHVVLNALDEAIADRSVADITAKARMLEAMDLGAEAVVVIHLGGVYGDKKSAMERFVTRYEDLPAAACQRLVLGDVISGQYEVLQVLGEGGFSRVYKVRDDIMGDGKTRLSKGKKVRPVPTICSGGRGREAPPYRNLAATYGDR